MYKQHNNRGLNKMNQETAKAKMERVLSGLGDSELQEIVSKLFYDDRSEAIVPLMVALDVLERRMSEKAFVEFCEQF